MLQACTMVWAAIYENFLESAGGGTNGQQHSRWIEYRCQVKMGTSQMGTPGPHFHMKLGTRVPNFLIFWGPLGPQFHMVLGTLP